MADRLKDAKIKAQLRAMKRDERDRCWQVCENIGYDLLAADVDGMGMAQQEAAEYCVAAIQALGDEV